MKKFVFSILVIFLMIIIPKPVLAEELTTCNLDDVVVDHMLISEVNNCDRIIVNTQTNLNKIDDLDGIKEIEFQTLTLDDISMINDIDTLEKLIITGSKISLKNINNNNLINLNIYNSYVKDLNYLKYTSVENIVMSDSTYFRDLEFLKSVPNLNTLSIDFPAYTNVDLNPILNLKHLRVLNLWGLEQNLNSDIINFLRKNNVKTSFSLNKVYENINSRVQNIYDSLQLEGLTDDEIIQKVVLYVLDNITYDNTLTGEAGQQAFQNEIMMEKALNKTGVCRQYTILLNALLEMAGYNAVQVRSTYDENHIWNEVYLNGTWYAIDPTWLDNEEGRAKVANNIRDTYYMVDPNGAFLNDHHPISNMINTLSPIFKITFESNGGTILEPKYVTSNTYSLPVPEKNNTTFEAWNTESELINSFEVTSLNKDLKLYASYDDTVRIENAGGIPNPPTAKIKYSMIGGILLIGIISYLKLRKHTKFRRI